MACLRGLWCALAVVAIGTAAFAQTPSVDDLVTKNPAAKGGADALRALTVKMTGRIKVPPASSQ